MKYVDIAVESYAGTTLKQGLFKQGSDTLVVILPGLAYTVFGPYLYYAHSVAIELGYDVLKVEYGYQKMNMLLACEKTDNVIRESRTAIDKAIEIGNYKTLVFIGKSFGTEIMTSILGQYIGKFQIIPVFITPIKSVACAIKAYNSFVIIGTDDPLYMDEAINDALEQENVQNLVIEGADHSLDLCNANQSIEQLKQYSIRLHEFLLQEIK